MKVLQASSVQRDRRFFFRSSRDSSDLSLERDSRASAVRLRSVMLVPRGTTMFCMPGGRYGMLGKSGFRMFGNS